MNAGLLGKRNWRALERILGRVLSSRVAFVPATPAIRSTLDIRVSHP